MKQHTQEWFAARHGKFTGSEIWKLIKPGKSGFSATAITYIYDVLAEILTNGKSAESKTVSSKATDWGLDYEMEAREVYQQFTGDIIDDCGFVQFSEYFGASPDGFIGDDGLIEIKCPYNSTNHIRHLLCKTAEDLPEEYFWQIQAELLATGRKWCDFVSYDPRCDERSCLKIIRVERDEVIMDTLKTRIELATNELLTILKTII